MVDLRRNVLLMVVTILMGAIGLFAQTRWEPFKLHPDVQYLKLQYEVKVNVDAPLNFAIEVKRLKGGMVDLAITHQARIPEDQLGAQTIVGGFSMYGVSAMVFFNPAYAIFFSQLDLKVGEKMSFFGAGYAKVTGEKTVAGRKGYVVEFYQREGETDRLVSRTVIDPKIFIPIENEMFNANGQRESHVVLVKGEVK